MPGLAVILTVALVLFVFVGNSLLRGIQKLARAHGQHMRRRVEDRRKLVVDRARDECERLLAEQKADQRRLGEADALHKWSGAMQQQQQNQIPSELSKQEEQKNKKSTSRSARASGTSLDEDWERVEQDSRTYSHDSATSNTGSQGEAQKDGTAAAGEDEITNVNAEWGGVVGFLHPFCNAGGGGERVLWAAIRATQKQYPKALCVVYTGDHEVDKEQMLEKVEQRFSIHIHPPTVVFMYLSTRHFVLATTWPRFTLLGQSIGSLIVGYDAFNLLVPDIFIDTMGYAFALALCKLLFPEVPTAAYVHYPTISTDMLGSLSVEKTNERGTGGIHAGTGAGLRGRMKRYYWNLFAKLYGWIGASIDVVMTNSSWTQDHIQQIWGPARLKRHARSMTMSADKSTVPAEKDTDDIVVVFPPVAVKELESAIPLTANSENLRTRTFIYIAQFRPEKNHELVLRAFAKYYFSQYPRHTAPAFSTTATTSKPDSTSSSPSSSPPSSPSAASPPIKLNLIGSVRDDADRSLVYSLRLLAHELHITDAVSFILDASWPECVAHLRTASVGVNAMWNEHFGIGVVEYQAAGLLAVVNDSGGPKRDIVVLLDGGRRTGWWASTVDEYADAFKAALDVVKTGKGKSRPTMAGSERQDGQASKKEEAEAEAEESIVEWRKRARRSAARFSEQAFEERWNAQLDKLVHRQVQLQKQKKT